MSIQKFAERLSTEATKLAGNVTQFLSDQRNIRQLNNDIAAAKLSLELLFAELGRLAYHGSAALAGVRTQEEIVADIRDTNEYISLLETELAEYVKKELDEEPLAEPTDKAPTEEPAQLYCHKCGKPQTSDNDYCPKCGTQLTK